MRLPKMTTAAALAALLAGLPLAASAQELVMWERSGGNAGMVDALVAAWNEANPTAAINLTTFRTPRWYPSSPRPSPRAKCPT